MLDKAAIIALRSKYRQHRIGCVITDKKGNIISTAVNSFKTHPTQKKYAQRMKSDNKNFYLHAEIAALVKCRKEPYAIYVARITKGGNIGLAKPCCVCQAAIKEAGIKEIHYTV